MTRPIKSKYSKELFEARAKLIVEEGLFTPLSDTIAKIINKHVRGSAALIDMGCGDGSLLASICDRIRPNLGVGIDISKEGTIVASKNYTDRIWAVADLANTPFKDGRFDVILNILSPSNYGEFNRLLKADGLVVKVVPQSSHLKELRQTIFKDNERQSYSNANTVERFNNNFQVTAHSKLRYTVALNHSSIRSLIQMTPLAWTMTEEQAKPLLAEKSAHITVDLEILAGKKN